jgi:hypothetical protein
MLVNGTGLYIMLINAGLPSRLANATGFPDWSAETELELNTTLSCVWLLSITESDGLLRIAANWTGLEVMLTYVGLITNAPNALTCVGFEAIVAREGFERRFVIISGLLLDALAMPGRVSTAETPDGFSITTSSDGFDSNDVNCALFVNTGLSDDVERKSWN